MDLMMNATSFAEGKYGLWLDFWTWADSVSDPRVKDWLFMSSVWPTVYLTLFYVVGVCGVGPKLMENRKPLDLRSFMVVYNFAMVVLSIYMWVTLLIGSLRRNYSWTCQPISTYSTHPDEVLIAGSLWWFYFSKFVEYTDTIIFVLRKKNSQISFLHIYHHATMFPLWWIGVKWVAGGNSFMPAMLNSFIHTVMYTYYGLAACGPALQPYLWWKKYLTKLQLIQFCICGAACIYSLYLDCDFPKWMHYALLFYASSLIVLFMNFYIKSYLKGKRPASENSVIPNGKKHK